MIGRSVLLAVSAAIACGLVVIAVFALGLGIPNAVWLLVPAAIAAVVATYEWIRMKRTPLDSELPGIVPGDE